MRRVTRAVGHEVEVFLPKVDGKPALLLTLHPGDAADVEHRLSGLILATKQTHLRGEREENTASLALS